MAATLPSRIRVCHLTSLHSRSDTRIFVKECRSLANHGYAVDLVVADGKGDGSQDGVRILDVGRCGGRLRRMLFGGRRVYRRALEVDADVYHFHDPELMPIARRLQKKGKRVVYDVHEDLPRQILSKHYLKSWIRPILSRVVERYENAMARRFDLIVAATPFIRDRFLRQNASTCDVNNFPIAAGSETVALEPREPGAVCYVGSISRVRGICELLDAAAKASVTLHLAGEFWPPSLLDELRRTAAWERVVYHGFVSRREVESIYARSQAGLVVLHPTESYRNALPVKLFEYMLAELPVIASDFPLWQEIVRESRCGLCVDPRNPDAIAAAIRYLLTHREEARQMGKSGRRAVLARYNWEAEEQKLVEAYRRLVGQPDGTRSMPERAEVGR